MHAISSAERMTLTIWFVALGFLKRFRQKYIIFARNLENHMDLIEMKWSDATDAVFFGEATVGLKSF